jgi:hypothetical protein
MHSAIETKRGFLAITRVSSTCRVNHIYTFRHTVITAKAGRQSLLSFQAELSSATFKLSFQIPL